MIKQKCKFNKICKYFDKESKTCNNGGMYYSPSRAPGCYRDQEEIITIKEDIKLMKTHGLKNRISHNTFIKVAEERLKELTDEI